MYALDHFMYHYIVLDNKHGVIWVGYVVLMDFTVVHLLSSNRLILEGFFFFLFCDIAEVMIIHKIG